MQWPGKNCSAIKTMTIGDYVKADDERVKLDYMRLKPDAKKKNWKLNRLLTSLRSIDKHRFHIFFFWNVIVSLLFRISYGSRFHVRNARTGTVLWVSVANFRKLGGKTSQTEKIYTSSKNWNYIHTTVFLLSNHWPSNKNIFLWYLCKSNNKIWITIFSLSIYKICWSRMKNISGTSSPELVFMMSYYHLLFRDQHIDFSNIFKP